MIQADSLDTTSPSRISFPSAGAVRRSLPPASRAVLAVGLPEIPDLPLPTRALPIAQPFFGGWLPVIYDGSVKTEWLRFERFPRKTKATADEALAYAGRVIWYRQVRENEKRRHREAVDHPDYWASGAWAEAAE